MTITLRSVKGLPLTNDEVDANFATLDTESVRVAGDIGGSTSAPSVVSLNGRSLSSSAPAIGQTLVWGGSAWTPTTPSVGNSSGNTVTVTDKINSQFNALNQVFTLKVNRTSIIEGFSYQDNKDLLVVLNGRVLDPYVKQDTLGPWIVDMTAESAYTYKVSGAKLILFRAPLAGETASIRLNTVSSARQITSRYPFTANTIAFGD
jgi:hypothetical protein